MLKGIFQFREKPFHFRTAFKHKLTSKDLSKQLSSSFMWSPGTIDAIRRGWERQVGSDVCAVGTISLDRLGVIVVRMNNAGTKLPRNKENCSIFQENLSASSQRVEDKLNVGKVKPLFSNPIREQRKLLGTGVLSQESSEKVIGNRRSPGPIPSS